MTMTIADLLEMVIDGATVKLCNTDNGKETEPTDDPEELIERYGDLEAFSIEADGDCVVINY